MSKKQRLPRYERVYRPPGLSIAIISTGIIYGLLPLLNMYFKWRIQAAGEDTLFGGGIDITTWDWAGAVFGFVMLLLCVPAWGGRPARIRWVFVGALVVVVLVHAIRIIELWMEDVHPIFGGQAEETLRNYLLCQVPVLIAVPLYVIWYLNRAPARAFYRRVPLASLTRAPDDFPATTTEPPSD
ncbi:MAG: hypothetical protein JXQ72_12640 [Anaerolineae bacterium]|nr:hypothetical protein [Anaerolineae bacterium]